jgi:hypothetical protein
VLYGNIPTTTETRIIYVPDGGGWVMLGFASLSTSRHAGDIPLMYSGGSITSVVSYIQATGKYLGWDDFEPTYNNFSLVPGEAYWVWCTASGALAYDP